MSAPRYIARVLTIPTTARPYPNPQEIGVFRVQDGKEEQVGAYQRNYQRFFRTFYHFRRRGKDYALYSPVYDHTRVLELPSCRDIGGEERVTFGFCPTDYYMIPTTDRLRGSFIENSAFVAGCEWQDEISYKIQHLDLSEVEKGIIKRSDRFGYIELPAGSTLEQAINMYRFYPESGQAYVTIAVHIHFDIETGKPHWYSIRGDYEPFDAFRE